MERVNLADVIGRPFDEVGVSLGYPLSVHGSINGARDFYFDTAIIASTFLVEQTIPRFIEWLSIQYTEPENNVITPFAKYEGFSSYAGSCYFHFNGLDYTSTFDDVEKAFSNEDFRRTYVKDIYGIASLFDIRNNTVDVNVLPSSAYDYILIIRHKNILYWNDDYADTFDYNYDGRVIGFTVLRNELYTKERELITP